MHNVNIAQRAKGGGKMPQIWQTIAFSVPRVLTRVVGPTVVKKGGALKLFEDE